MANLENSQRWSQIVEASREQGLGAVARKFGVTTGEIASALKRAGISRTAITGPGGPVGAGTSRAAEKSASEQAGGQDGEDARRESARSTEPEAATESQATASAVHQASGGDGREDAGIERESAATAADADDAGTPSPRSGQEPEEESAAEPADTEEEETQGRVDRGSRLDPFRDLIGAIPDAAVAQQSGMSIQAVRNYRQKRGIAPAGRRRTPDEVEIGRAAPASAPPPAALPPVAAETRAESPRQETPQAEAPRPAAAPVPQSGGREPSTTAGFGWRIGLESGGQVIHRVVVAPDAASAVARAAGAGLGDILTLERLEEAL